MNTNIIYNSNEIINNSNFNDMINEEALVATPNAAENNNAVATASVEQVNNTKTMGTFNFSTTLESAVKKYDNVGAYQTLLTMMKNKELLAVKFFSSKDGIPCAWIESKRVAGFKYELKSETFQGLMNYLSNGDTFDFDSNPTKTDTLDEGADFQQLVLRMFVESGKTLQYVPLFRENPLYINAVLSCFRGKVLFRIKRSEELLDYLRENKQIA